ncbi:MAG: alanine--tRNA ligase-related protein [Usitatibacteraceae bacterium]
MTGHDTRQKFLDYFSQNAHRVVKSSSLVPANDPTLLFTNAGMNQFKGLFLGEEKRDYSRATTSQKCVRAGGKHNDLENVGYTRRHHTFFEMLGNFSFGDYFKKEAIAFSWEFMTSKEWLGLDVNRLSFTVFESDDEAYECWSEHLRSVGIDPTTRVFRLGQDTNYWPAGSFTAGPPGPCGPNTEMFYWADNALPVPTAGYTREDWIRDEGQGLWLEIWNDVFIQSEWQGQLNDPSRPEKGWKKSGMPDLPFKSVDTGMGLDRTACVLNGFKSVYDTDAFQPIFRLMESVGTGLSYGSDPTKDHAMRIVADHLRTAVFCITDGILPGNSGRGYVLRRLIRRAVLKGQRVLGFDKPFFASLVEAVVEAMGGHYQELHARQALIIETLTSEENLFRRTISEGIEIFTTPLDSHLRSPRSSAKRRESRSTSKAIGRRWPRLKNARELRAEWTPSTAELARSASKTPPKQTSLAMT